MNHMISSIVSIVWRVTAGFGSLCDNDQNQCIILATYYVCSVVSDMFNANTCVNRIGPSCRFILSNPHSVGTIKDHDFDLKIGTW